MPGERLAAANWSESMLILSTFWMNIYLFWTRAITLTLLSHHVDLACWQSNSDSYGNFFVLVQN